MFGALNRFISRLDGEPQPSQSSSRNAYGFQVLRNSNTESPLEPWFDFIIGINGRTIDNPDPNLFATEVRNSAGSTISLGVYSAKGQKIREHYVPVSAETGSIGVSLQWTPIARTEDVWHILDVAPNSPADMAGLLPYGDYVIGSPEGHMRGEGGLGELVEDYLNRPLRLWVYNHEYNVTRPVTITPSRNWGGTGALGCTLGFGALHRIPASLEEPPHAPGETMFETARFSNEEARPSSSAAAATYGFSNAPPTTGSPAPPPPSADFLVPANMQFKPTSPPPPTGGAAPAGHGRAKKTRVHHAISPGAGIDDYFREGEEKSKEQDYGSSPGLGAGNIAPPPKAGGPPRPTSTAPAAESPGEDAG